VIVKFDGKDVTTMRGLPRLVSQTQIGREIEIEVSRKGQRMTFRVTIGRLVEEAKPAPKTGVRVAPKSRSKGRDGSLAPPRDRLLAGLVLVPLTEELRAKHGLGRDVKGVLVLEVDPKSPAAARNVKVGDVVVEVAREAVNSIEDVAKAVEGALARNVRRNVLLRLADAKGDLRFVAVPIE
jgi:serine protease Do